VLRSHALPFAVVGVYPHMGANGVGELGAVLFLWTLGRTIAARRRVLGWPLFFMVVGLATLVAAQYRTGYVGLAFTLLVLAVARARVPLVLAALAATIVVGWFSLPTILDRVQPYALRGDTTAQAEELSGRLYFWSHALPIWEKSPVLGRGLATATRFEVLSPLGFGGTSTIHGTWIEALVGTGVVGVALLGAFLLLLWRYAVPDLVRPDGRVWPALLIAFATVRSLTGSTFEIFGFTTLLLLALSFTLQAQPVPAAGAAEDEPSERSVAPWARRPQRLPA
jgi:O-antigen ligase